MGIFGSAIVSSSSFIYLILFLEPCVVIYYGLRLHYPGSAEEGCGLSIQIF